LVEPPTAIVEDFCDMVSPMLELAKNLGMATPLLQHSRDLLLPRLISGEMDVSNIGIETNEVGA